MTVHFVGAVSIALFVPHNETQLLKVKLLESFISRTNVAVHFLVKDGVSRSILYH